MRVKIIMLLTNIKEKYRATTILSRLECVLAPMYCDSQRMTRGKKKLKPAAMVGGTTPATRA